MELRDELLLPAVLIVERDVDDPVIVGRALDTGRHQRSDPNRFDAVPKDNVLLRYLDIPLTPLICWLEAWYGHLKNMPTKNQRGKSATELVGFHDELMAVMSPAGVSTV